MNLVSYPNYSNTKLPQNKSAVGENHALESAPRVIEASIPQPRETSPRHYSKQQKALNKQLQHHVRLANPVKSVELIRQGADPNAKNGKGKTPLQEALSTNDPIIPTLQKCKFLIDHGAIADENDQRKIATLIDGHTRSIPIQRLMPIFLCSFPTPYEPELFFNHRFHRLQDLPPEVLQQLTKKIALLNFAQENLDYHHYGAVSEQLTPSHHPIYEWMSESCTVVRAVVNDPEYLVIPIRFLRQCLPQLPLAYWALDGHGEMDSKGRGSLDVGFGARLTSDDAHTFGELFEFFDPHTAVAFLGCSTGLEKNGQNVANLAKSASLHANGRVVFGANGEPFATVYYRQWDEHLQERRIIPFFQHETDACPVNAYVHGQLIASSDDGASASEKARFFKAVSRRSFFSPPLRGSVGLPAAIAQ